MDNTLRRKNSSKHQNTQKNLVVQPHVHHIELSISPDPVPNRKCSVLYLIFTSAHVSSSVSYVLTLAPLLLALSIRNESPRVEPHTLSARSETPHTWSPEIGTCGWETAIWILRPILSFRFKCYCYSRSVLLSGWISEDSFALMSLLIDSGNQK